MIESHKCSLCNKAVHSKAIITHCQHPMCFTCMRGFKELRDIRCPLCSDDYNLGKRLVTEGRMLNYSLYESAPLDLSSIAVVSEDYGSEPRKRIT